MASIICMHFGWNDGFNIIFFIGIVYAFALNSGRLHVLCNGRLAQYLGKISYSIYLMQLFPIIPLWLGVKLPGLVYDLKNPNNTATTSFWIGVGYCLIYMGLVIRVSSLTYFTIEKPCRKWINAKWGKEAMPVYA